MWVGTRTRRLIRPIPELMHQTDSFLNAKYYFAAHETLIDPIH